MKSPLYRNFPIEIAELISIYSPDSDAKHRLRMVFEHSFNAVGKDNILWPIYPYDSVVRHWLSLFVAPLVLALLVMAFPLFLYHIIDWLRLPTKEFVRLAWSVEMLFIPSALLLLFGHRYSKRKARSAELTLEFLNLILDRTNQFVHVKRPDGSFYAVPWGGVEMGMRRGNAPPNVIAYDLYWKEASGNLIGFIRSLKEDIPGQIKAYEQFMSLDKPLPDIPILERYRKEDEVTLKEDQKNERFSHFWSALTMPSIRQLWSMQLDEVDFLNVQRSESEIVDGQSRLKQENLKRKFVIGLLTFPVALLIGLSGIIQEGLHGYNLLAYGQLHIGNRLAYLFSLALEWGFWLGMAFALSWLIWVIAVFIIRR